MILTILVEELIRRLSIESNGESSFLMNLFPTKPKDSPYGLPKLSITQKK